jgi:hypothetical protein
MHRDKTRAAADEALAKARRHDATNGERFAIRRGLRALTVEEHGLEREMASLIAAAAHEKAEIERGWRDQHWGQNPEHAWAWRDTAGREAPDIAAPPQPQVATTRRALPHRPIGHTQ